MKHFLIIVLLIGGSNAFAQGHLNMDSLFNWQDASLPASAAHSNTYNEVWGYAKNGREYAIIGSTMGTHIFDVTVPANSVQVEFIEGAFTGPNVIHRHFHDYDDYLYMVCDEGPSTLQIADLRFLPDSAPVVYDSDALFPRAHNIFIDSSSARLYACGGTVLYSVYSLADPTMPTLLSNCPVDIPFWSSIGYIHDTYVRNDTAYLNAENRGLFIVDFTDVSDPQMIGSLDVYPQQGYNHSGWLNPNAPFYAMADETHGKDVKIVDVSDMSDLEVSDTISTDVSPFSIPHNLVFRDHHLFISYYFDGVYMFDCQDPAHPVLTGFYDTSTEPHQDGFYRGCWGVYPLLPSGNILASDMQTGLWVFGTNLPSGVSVSQENDELGIYPNPTNGPLNFKAMGANAQFSIFDLMGKEVKTGTTNGSINVAELIPGPYILQLTANEKTGQSQFLKR